MTPEATPQRQNPNDSLQAEYKLKGLLQEYELKFRYRLMMSTRIYQITFAHLLFTGACLAAYKDMVLVTWGLALLNIAVSSLAIWWIFQAQDRSKDRGRRIKEIARELKIGGYGGTDTPIFRPTSISLASMIWIGLAGAFWVMVWIRALQ